MKSRKSEKSPYHRRGRQLGRPTGPERSRAPTPYASQAGHDPAPLAEEESIAARVQILLSRGRYEAARELLLRPEVVQVSRMVLCAVENDERALWDTLRPHRERLVREAARRELLPLSMCVRNCRALSMLEGAGISTVHQLLMRRRADLLAIPNFGRLLLDGVLRDLADLGFVTDGSSEEHAS